MMAPAVTLPASEGSHPNSLYVKRSLLEPHTSSSDWIKEKSGFSEWCHLNGHSTEGWDTAWLPFGLYGVIEHRFHRQNGVQPLPTAGEYL